MFGAVIYILRLCNAYFVIHPCDNNESCRLFKIKYVDDNRRVYAYKKKFCEADPKHSKPTKTTPEQNDCDDICYEFIIVLGLLTIAAGVINFGFTGNLRESITLSLIIVMISVFFPSLTLHAVNSNDYITRVFVEEPTDDHTKPPRTYTFETTLWPGTSSEN